MVTLFKILIATLILSSCAISMMTFDLAALSIETNGSLVHCIRENNLMIGIFGGILLLGFIAEKKMFTERTS